MAVIRDINFTSNHFVIFVNGRKIEDKDVKPETTLLTYLRRNLSLTGTKLGCGEGGCGACTVMVSTFDPQTETIKHFAVNACLMPLVALHNSAITTVEGIGSTRNRLHEVQKRLSDYHGSQCGFCTPGIVMSMYVLLRNKIVPSMDEIMTHLQGNLCRCTGYRPILECFKTFSKVQKNGCCGQNCCSQTQEPDESNRVLSSQLVERNDFVPYHESQEVIFPPELKKLVSSSSIPRMYKSDRMKWFCPQSFDQLLELKSMYPEAKVVVGNTELGIEMKTKHYPIMIQANNVSELNQVSLDENGLKIGASTTLTKLESLCQTRIAQEPSYKTRIFVEIINMLQLFAGKQIRNVAAVAGNIMTGSPISDLVPILMAAGCEMEAAEHGKGVRTFIFNHDFYKGYRKPGLNSAEVLLSIKIPYTRKDEYFKFYKQSRRREDDIAIVNAAVLFRISANHRVENCRIALGGMAPTTMMPLKIMKFMKNRIWTSPSTLEGAMDTLLEETCLAPGTPGGMERYRQALALGLFYKAVLAISKETDTFDTRFEDRELGILDHSIFHQSEVQSHQLFDIPISKGTRFDPVGRPIKHRSADIQVSGEAEYTDDIPKQDRELYIAYVYSQRAHANILSVDATMALDIKDVVDYISNSDITPEQNKFSTAIFEDELIFAENRVYYYGQVIGAVLAESPESARRATALVRIEYGDLTPILTIDEAIRLESFHDSPNTNFRSGDVESAFRISDHVLTGEVRTGGQEHFYLETQSGIVIPEKDGCYKLYCSTQNPTAAQMSVSSLLKIPMNKVTCVVKRLGGGFGGKETRFLSFLLPATVAAKKHERPVKYSLDRNEDMIMSGTRHPMLGRYKVGFDKTGLIEAVEVDIYVNAGWTMDLSYAVVERAMLHATNGYKVKNVAVNGLCCKTNIPSNTAFRGFGLPQVMMITETWIDEVAEFLGVSPLLIRERNFYAENDVTYYNQPVTNFMMSRCWKECLVQSDYFERLKSIREFNSANKWKKRGISIIPTMYGLAFGLVHYNQAGALIHVYSDGSVFLSHAGVEMGQGLHTKTVQVASKVLGIHHDKIFISGTTTDKVPNTSPTAASVGSDLNGAAVLNACQKIVSRLEPIRKSHPKASWEETVQLAYKSSISLSATGHYYDMDLSMDWSSGKGGSPISYFSYGAGCSVVEIDVLTGDHRVLKTDIVMDVGESLNPAIDIGQIEGAFTQGYGLFIMEQILHSPSGRLITTGPGAYKIPGFGDIPIEFNVSLLRKSSNPRAVYSSKGIGEPPLFLASSVYFAIKDALRYARKENGHSTQFKLPIPATSERIRMASEDDITAKIPQLQDTNNRPWALQL